MEGWCEMSASDYGLLFAMILLVLVLFHTIHLVDYQTVRGMQEQYNLAVDQAVEAALYDSVESDSGREICINEKAVIHKFFQALYINLGIMEQPMKKELCKFYVPFILFVGDDGITPYLQMNRGQEELVSFHNEKKVLYEWKGDEEDALRFTLSDYVVYENPAMQMHLEGYYSDVLEQLPEWFHWSLQEFREKKKHRIIELIKECTNESINYQNQIAKKFGIHYEFTLPVIEYEEWYRTIQDVSMLVLFQGYPYGNGITGTYNRVAFGGARIAKR